MLYNFKSKFNVHEIQRLLTEYVGTLFTDIKRCPWDKAPKSKVYLFEGKCIQTGRVYLFRVRYDRTDNWGRRFHVYSVEFKSNRENGYDRL